MPQLVPLVEATIRAVLEDWVASRRMFTLYDVTREVRSRVGRDVPVPHLGPDGIHDTVLAALNDLVGNDPDWDRTLVSPRWLKPGADKPQLYYHASCDPAAYEEAPVSVKASVTPRATPALPTPPTLPMTPNPSTLAPVIAAPADKRVCVPRSMLDAVGLHPGDHVTIAVSSQGELLIKRDDPNATDPGTDQVTRVVDVRGTLRISQNTLKEAGVHGDSVIVEKDADRGLLLKKG